MNEKEIYIKNDQSELAVVIKEILIFSIEDSSDTYMISPMSS